MPRAHATGDVGATSKGAVELGTDRFDLGAVALFHRRVDRPGRQVQRAHGVAAQDRGVVDGLVILEVLLAELDLPEQATAAQIRKRAPERCTRLVQRRPGSERGLRLRMPPTASRPPS